MLRLLLGKTEKPTASHPDPLDIMRYTRVEPRESRMINQKPYSRFSAPEKQECEAPSPKAVVRRVQMAPASTPRPQAVAKAEVNLAAHLYSDGAISVSLLRRSLPKRFRAIDARRQQALMDSDTLEFAMS
jgi:hypothetical protein